LFTYCAAPSEASAEQYDKLADFFLEMLLQKTNRDKPEDFWSPFRVGNTKRSSLSPETYFELMEHLVKRSWSSAFWARSMTVASGYFLHLAQIRNVLKIVHEDLKNQWLPEYTNSEANLRNGSQVEDPVDPFVDFAKRAISMDQADRKIFNNEARVLQAVNETLLEKKKNQHLRGEKYEDLCKFAVLKCSSAIKDVNPQLLLDNTDLREANLQDGSQVESTRWLKFTKRVIEGGRSSQHLSSQFRYINFGSKWEGWAASVLRAVSETLLGSDEHQNHQNLRGEKYAELCKSAVRKDSFAIKNVNLQLLLKENTDSETVNLRDGEPQVLAERYFEIADLAIKEASEDK